MSDFESSPSSEAIVVSGGTITTTQGTTPWVVSIDQTGTNNDVEVVNGAGAAAVNVQDGGNSLTVDGTVAVSNFPATQPVSGTVIANQGTAGVAAWPIKISQTGTDNDVDANITNASLAVTQSGTWNVGLNAGANTIGKVDQGLGGASAWKVDGSAVIQPVSGTVAVSNFPATQPVSGTVTANQGTANSIANAWPEKITDGTNTATVTAASALKVDGSAVTQPVSGTVTANQGTSPWVIGDGGGSITVDNAGTFATQASQAGTWNINNISGTVSLPTGASTSANQTTANTSLASIDGKLNSLGQKIMAASVPVTIASDQSFYAGTQGTGTITTNGGTVTAVTNGASQITFNITGTFTSVVAFQAAVVASPSASDWFLVTGLNSDTGVITGAILSVPMAVSVPVSGYTQVRAISVFYVSGTITVQYSVNDGDGLPAASTVPDRPSQKPGRTYKTAVADQLTANNTLYTVTSGKVLYVSSITINCFATAGTGHVQIRDNATVRLPISMPVVGLGANLTTQSAIITCMTFLEPMQFATNFNVNIAAGTVTYSISFVGYEE